VGVSDYSREYQVCKMTACRDLTILWKKNILLKSPGSLSLESSAVAVLAEKGHVFAQKGRHSRMVNLEKFDKVLDWAEGDGVVPLLLGVLGLVLLWGLQ
jgi:hypothetical protein